MTPYLQTFENRWLNSLETCRYECRKLIDIYIKSRWAACTATLKRLFDVHRQYLPDYMDEQM